MTERERSFSKTQIVTSSAKFDQALVDKGEFARRQLAAEERDFVVATRDAFGDQKDPLRLYGEGFLRVGTAQVKLLREMLASNERCVGEILDDFASRLAEANDSLPAARPEPRDWVKLTLTTFMCCNLAVILFTAGLLFERRREADVKASDQTQTSTMAGTESSHTVSFEYDGGQPSPDAIALSRSIVALSQGDRDAVRLFILTGDETFRTAIIPVLQLASLHARLQSSRGEKTYPGCLTNGPILPPSNGVKIRTCIMEIPANWR